MTKQLLPNQTVIQNLVYLYEEPILLLYRLIRTESGWFTLAGFVRRFCRTFSPKMSIIFIPLASHFSYLGTLDTVDVFGKILNLLWQIFYAIGTIFTVVNGQILNK